MSSKDDSVTQASGWGVGAINSYPPLKGISCFILTHDLWRSSGSRYIRMCIKVTINICRFTNDIVDDAPSKLRPYCIARSNQLIATHVMYNNNNKTIHKHCLVQAVEGYMEFSRRELADSTWKYVRLPLPQRVTTTPTHITVINSKYLEILQAFIEQRTIAEQTLTF